MMNQFSPLFSVIPFKYQQGIAWFVNVHFSILVYIAISMTCNGDRFLPVLHAWLNSFYHDRSAENSSVQDGTDGSIRALIHFLQIILGHSGFVRGNSGTLNSNAVFFCGFCCIYGYLIICLVSVFQSKVIVFCFQIYKRKKKLILNHLPQNSGHLVPVHLYKRGLHLNFTHYFLLV